MASKSNEDIDIPFYQKAIALAVVCIIGIVVFYISSIFTNNDGGVIPSGYKTCETRFDSTACPEPDNDEWLKNNPDIP